MSLWDLDLHCFQDISAFDGSRLLLSTGINTKSKCHDLELFRDISVGVFVWFFLYVQYLTFELDVDKKLYFFPVGKCAKLPRLCFPLKHWASNTVCILPSHCDVFLMEKDQVS